ncbi:MAG: hypothetical protein P8X42_09890 [Calditrichaceae bacterium]|jgi:hypothetical protein
MFTFQKNIIILLTIILAILLAIAAYCGAFIPETYQRDTASIAVQGIGQDFVNLFLVVPLLIIVLPFIKRDQNKALLFHAGTLFYILYSFIIYTMGVYFNFLFLLYCFILGLSIYAFMITVYVLVNNDVSGWFPGKIPIRITGVFLIFIAVMFYLLWLKEVIPAVLSNSVPRSVSDYKLLVNPVHVLDISFVLPGLIISAVLLFKRNKFGFIFSVIALEFIVLLAIALIAMVVMLQIRGISDDSSIAGIFTVLAVIGLVLLGLIYKNYNNN